MNKKALTEADIRAKFITPALLGANSEKWNVMTQIREEAYFTKGRVIVRGKTVKRGEVQRSKAEHAILGFPGRCVQHPLPNLRGALQDAFLLPGRAKHFQAAQRDVVDREQTSFTGRPDGLRLPMIEVSHVSRSFRAIL